MFERFAQLPPELRRLIWRYALPGPRLIMVVSANPSPGSGLLYIDRCDGLGPRHTPGFSKLEEQPRGPPPSLFHVCRESRRLALESYEFCFNTRISSTSLLTEECHSSPLFPRHAGQPSPAYKPPIVRPVPHAERTCAGVRFRPACDTIYLANAGYGIFQMLTHARADELETTNIQSLAVDFGCYEQVTFRLLGLDAPFLGGLKELVVIAEEDAEAERIGVLDAGVSRCREAVAAQVARLRVKHPRVRFPVVAVMTQAILLQSMALTGGSEI
jgi:2EXR family